MTLADIRFDDLWSLAEANRKALRILEGDDKDLVKVVAISGGKVLDFARRESPFLTGTLSSAHRGEIEEVSGLLYRVLFDLFIDENVVNPVTGDKPVEYGPVVHRAFPWFLITLDWFEANLLDILEDELLVTIQGPYQTL